MDVRCPQCETLYELDEEQVANRPVTLKCSQCQHLFRLEGKAAVSQENQRRWMIRRKDEGDILYLNSFDVLHEWIMKQEIQTVDEISRTGNKWVALGEIGEFTPLFQVVESITQLGADLEDRADVSSIATRMKSETPASNPSAASVRQEPGRERVRTSLQFGGGATRQEIASPDSSGQQRADDITKKVGPEGPPPANDLPPSPHHEDEPTQPGDSGAVPAAASTSHELGVDLSGEVDASIPQAPRRGSIGGFLMLVGVLILAAVGGYLWLAEPEFVDRMQGDSQDVVPIVKEDGTAPVDPHKEVDEAIVAAVTAAEAENDAIWTMWYETASEPFYVALDTAYAAADEASVGVELEEKIAKARTMLENGRPTQASTLFQRALAKEPNNPAAITGMGWTLLELGRTREAVAKFKKSTTIDPNYGDAYIGMGTAQRQLGNLREAYDAYDLYLGRFPRGPKASIASYQMSQLRKQLGM